MNCPSCGKEMEAGWLYSRGQPRWSPKPPDKFFPVKGRKSVWLNGPAMDPPAAHICEGCRTVVVEY